MCDESSPAKQRIVGIVIVDIASRLTSIQNIAWFIVISLYSSKAKFGLV